MRVRVSWWLVLVSMLSGCALMDTEDGAMWTSSVQTVPAKGYPKGTTVLVHPFTYPAETAKSTVVATYFPTPFYHTYAFNAVDKSNLRDSVIRSLQASDVTVIDPVADPTANRSAATMKLTVHVVSISMNGLVPRFALDVHVERESNVIKESKLIQGEAAFGGPKDDAVRKFVREIHRSLGATP